MNNLLKSVQITFKMSCLSVHLLTEKDPQAVMVY